MHRSRKSRLLFVFATMALLLAACSGRSESSSDGGGADGNGSGNDNGTTGVVSTEDCPDTDTAGIEDNTITLASSFPQNDPLLKAFAEISKGYKAYFESVNDAGGVQVGDTKYKIEVVDKDDAYDENKTAENINALVGEEGDKAFAVFNVVGTDNNLNIRQDLNDLCVPNVFAGTGSPAWGNSEYPWMIGSTLAPYTLETKAFADYLIKNQPDAKVAMLLQDDDFGKAYEEGFKQAIEGSDVTIAKIETYKKGTYDVDSQVTSLANSGADAFFNGATLVACPNALTAAKVAEDWDVTTFVSGTCISKTLMGIADKDGANDDILSVTNIKDPMNPAYADDEAMQEYVSTMEEFGEEGVDTENGIVAYGYTQGVLLVKILEGLPELTRSNLMNAMYAQDGLTGGLLIDGSTVTTSPNDRYLAENVQLIQYDNAEKHFNNVGEVLDFEGQTAEYTPAALIAAD